MDVRNECAVRLEVLKLSNLKGIRLTKNENDATPSGRSLRNRSQIKKPGRFEQETIRRETGKAKKKGLKNNQEKITNYFNKTPKPKKMKFTSEDTSSDSEYFDESEDQDSDIENVSFAKDEDQDSDRENVKMKEDTDYAAMVARNIEEKMAFLKFLNIPGAKEQVLSGLPKTTPQRRGITTKKLEKRSTSPQRTSKRLQRLEPDGEPLKDEPKIKIYPYPNSNDIYKTYTPRLPVTSSLGLKQTCTLTNVDVVEQFLNGLSGDLVPFKDDVPYNKEILSKMRNKEELIAKVVPDRVYSMAVHPDATRQRLIAAGGRTGYLGLWDVGSSEGEDGVFLFHPCRDSINCLYFESGSLLCCSYEGTLKRLDLRTGDFNHLYATPDNELTRCTHFDALSEHTYLVSESAGCVVSVDSRTPGIKEEQSFECHEKPVKTVHVHPVNKHYFLTASNDGTAALWDVRCMKSMYPVAYVNQKRSVNCAYFSPVTGNSFLTVSYDDTVKVYDCTGFGPQMKQTVSIRHDNQVGRWVTPFRAQWIPNQEELFAVATKNQPRDISVFAKSNERLEHTFTSDYLGSIVSIIAFHPKIPLVAGGNASGKVYLFQDEDYS